MGPDIPDALRPPLRAPSSDLTGPQRRVADALRHAATVIEEAPWELGPSQRVSVDFAPNANETEVAIHGCSSSQAAHALGQSGASANLAGGGSVEFQHDGLTVVFYRR